MTKQEINTMRRRYTRAELLNLNIPAVQQTPPSSIPPGAGSGQYPAVGTIFNDAINTSQSLNSAPVSPAAPEPERASQP